MMIGTNIKRLRELRGLSQSELASKLGISDKTVSSWEINRTEPKIGMIEKLCCVLECRKTDIIGGESSSDDGYYVSSDTKDVADAILNNKDLRLLFDAAKDASPEDLKTVHTMLLALKKKEEGFED